jgi:hypothetical protein
MRYSQSASPQGGVRFSGSPCGGRGVYRVPSVSVYGRFFYGGSEHMRISLFRVCYTSLFRVVVATDPLPNNRAGPSVWPQPKNGSTA